jgi:aminoglycoside 3-N-acetyltransferase
MLCGRDGAVVLIGVGLNRCSLLHYAEELAGRQLFYRWALDSQGEVIECQVGGCCEGFARLSTALEFHGSIAFVGESQWIVLPASDAAHAAASAIRADPTVTHCGRSDCHRCDDAVAGGPLPRLRART